MDDDTGQVDWKFTKWDLKKEGESQLDGKAD